MRIAIVCGGTGGHFYPGYALGRELRQRGHETLFLLRKDDPAGRTLLAEDLPFTEIDLRGMPRSLGWAAAVFVGKLMMSLRAARRIERAYRPEVLVGMGGYLTYPAAFAARLAGIPLVLHESNSVLGLANDWSLRWAEVLALGLPLRSAARPSVKTVLTGTPVRREFWAPPDAAQARKALGLDEKKPVLLVFGGSQGAAALNRGVPPAVGLLSSRRPNAFQVLHLSGPKDKERVAAAYASLPVRSSVLAYLEAMHLACAAADLALCRAGASTLAELIALAKPALLVPYPSAAANHQEANARILEAAGAAAVVLEHCLAPETLASELESLLLDDYPRRLRRMSDGYSGLKLPKPERCAAALADIVEAAGKRYRKSGAS